MTMRNTQTDLFGNLQEYAYWLLDDLKYSVGKAIVKEQSFLHKRVDMTTDMLEYCVTYTWPFGEHPDVVCQQRYTGTTETGWKIVLDIMKINDQTVRNIVDGVIKTHPDVEHPYTRGHLPPKHWPKRAGTPNSAALTDKINSFIEWASGASLEEIVHEHALAKQRGRYDYADAIKKYMNETYPAARPVKRAGTPAKAKDDGLSVYFDDLTTDSDDDSDDRELMDRLKQRRAKGRKKAVMQEKDELDYTYKEEVDYMLKAAAAGDVEYYKSLRDTLSGIEKML